MHDGMGTHRLCEGGLARTKLAHAVPSRAHVHDGNSQEGLPARADQRRTAPYHPPMRPTGQDSPGLRPATTVHGLLTADFCSGENPDVLTRMLFSRRMFFITRFDDFSATVRKCADETMLAQI